MTRRVVVTGLGMVSPLGVKVPSTWEGILKGQSGIRPIRRFDASEYATRFAGEVPEFDSTQYMSAKEVRKFDTFVLFGVAAATQALQDANLIVAEHDADRIGVAIGSGIGGIPLIERTHQCLVDGGPRRISPFFIPGSIINMVAGVVSIQHGLRGPNISLVTACTTGTHSIGLAGRMIKYGDADVMLAGGTEMATSPLGVGGFASARALSTRNDAPEKASRPWDKDRDGFVLADGAGVIVLEEYEHARRRGAKIYAELVGFGMSADAYHITSPLPDGTGFQKSMQNALHDAGLNRDQVDYINAHGTSTQVGDELEALAVKLAFEDHAKKLAISSTKSMTGHLLGAAGAVEAIFSVLAIRDQVAPPTINLDNPSDNCDLDFVPHTARQMKIDVVMSNSFGFGGTNGTIVFRRFV
jgi:3-oxoacyl-[acyl-carrier-protein] synthase II